jgi:hypothetical protein
VSCITNLCEVELVFRKPALAALLARAFVTLKSGVILPPAAIALALNLERRGIRLSLDSSGQVAIATAA